MGEETLIFKGMYVAKIIFASIAKAIASGNFDDQPLLDIVSEEIIDVGGEIIVDATAKNTAEERILESLKKHLHSIEELLYNTEGRDLDDPTREAIRFAISQTIIQSNLDPYFLVSLDLSPDSLKKHLIKNSGDAVKLFSPNEISVFNIIIEALSQQIIEDSTKLKDFLLALYAEILRKQSSILDGQEKANQTILALANKIERLERSVQENLAQPSHKENTNSHEDLLETLNRDNPGVKFEIHLSEEEYTLIALPRASDTTPQVGRLKFPQTPRGRIGLGKFIRLVREGYPANFEEGEYEWEWDLALPENSELNYSLQELQLRNNLPATDISIKLEIDNIQQETIYSLNFAKLHFERIGTEEQEVVISLNKLPEIIRIITTTKANASLNITPVELHNLPIEVSEEYIKLQIALIESDSLRVTSLDSNTELFKLSASHNESISEHISLLRKSLTLIEYIQEINFQLNIALQYPEQIDADTLFTAEELYHALKFGYFDDPRKAKLTLNHNKEGALEALDRIGRFDIENSHFITPDCELSADFMGLYIPLGRACIRLEELSLKDNIDEMRAQIENLQDGETFAFNIAYGRSFKFYSDLYGMEDKSKILERE